MQEVAAYCRVSTDKEDQANSLESQKKYFREYIDRNPYWELPQVYVDEGITGTSTKKRVISVPGRHGTQTDNIPYMLSLSADAALPGSELF